jgi:hypothetical protein
MYQWKPKNAKKKNPNRLLSKAHLTNLDFNHLKIVEAVGLRIVASRSP